MASLFEFSHTLGRCRTLPCLLNLPYRVRITTGNRRAISTPQSSLYCVLSSAPSALGAMGERRELVDSHGNPAVRYFSLIGYKAIFCLRQGSAQKEGMSRRDGHPMKRSEQATQVIRTNRFVIHRLHDAAYFLAFSLPSCRTSLRLSLRLLHPPKYRTPGPV